MSEKQTSSARWLDWSDSNDGRDIAFNAWKAQDAHYLPLLAQRDAEIAKQKKQIECFIHNWTESDKVKDAELDSLRKQNEKAEKVIDKARFAILREHGEIRQRQERREFLETVQSYDSIAALNQDKPKGEG